MNSGFVFLRPPPLPHGFVSTDAGLFNWLIHEAIAEELYLRTPLCLLAPKGAYNEPILPR